MISPDDPRLTAHADGALPPEEAARFERELAADPAAREELERLRGLQRALREAFAEETAEDEAYAAFEAPAPTTPVANAVVGVPMTPPRPGFEPDWEADMAQIRAQARARERKHPLAWLFPGWLAPVAGVASVVLLLAAIVIAPADRMRETARLSVAASNLRQILLAAKTFADDNQDKLPRANSVWDFAGQLARGADLNDAGVWRVPGDPAAKNLEEIPGVLTHDRRLLHPDFARSQLSIAVYLGEVTTSDPATTPIAWTRGLQPDGTWAAHSPYGRQGGHIAFLDGQVVFYRNVRDKLARHDGQGKTSNILDALPPGARISEYIPTDGEQAKLAKAYRGLDDSFLGRLLRSAPAMLVLAAATGLGAVAMVYLLSRKRLGDVGGSVDRPM